jgi:hypothetical protein
VRKKKFRVWILNDLRYGQGMEVPMADKEKVTALILMWPSQADFGRDIGVQAPVARMMCQRGVIPRAHWDVVLRKAKSRGIAVKRADLELWHEGLRMHGVRKKRPGPTGRPRGRPRKNPVPESADV